MLIRIFRKLESGVINVRIQTEDWSEIERGNMVKLGEPKINLGGTIFPAYGSTKDYASRRWSSSLSGEEQDSSEEPVKLDDMYVRVMSESPFTRKFDIRDYGMERAYGLANGWVDTIVDRIRSAVEDLRDFDSGMTTEEIVEI